eukprot:scaffold7147_cov130-Isochrysis_galbana.AAC.3
MTALRMHRLLVPCCMTRTFGVACGRGVGKRKMRERWIRKGLGRLLGGESTAAHSAQPVGSWLLFGGCFGSSPHLVVAGVCSLLARPTHATRAYVLCRVARYVVCSRAVRARVVPVGMVCVHFGQQHASEPASNQEPGQLAATSVVCGPCVVIVYCVWRCAAHVPVRPMAMCYVAPRGAQSLNHKP